ncbi:YfhL family 4Fe-4S dicluster ferredoxin [Paraburkholderia dinghuensis]|uniref:YfhL family 4Fe-4S dicluster ferredoxin n=1 Tax=Paraburkholderia dinghuensis TaxID=2305225 RepID=A0A3N6NW86_9BURK|nr:YfhL family 4Fe-4S dicluster ferredoxin [Paraburkholderia dinghuensis]RQH04883.1 YfhL family 4Fe-4S dicluster ferredoxin [Paraburkholderia dinghuensis]
MALMILDICSRCDACLSECPNEAITAGRPYTIDPSRCSECVGFFDTPQCQDMCPVMGCIVPDPHHPRVAA